MTKIWHDDNDDKKVDYYSENHSDEASVAFTVAQRGENMLGGNGKNKSELSTEQYVLKPETAAYRSLLLTPQQEELKRDEKGTWPLYEYKLENMQGKTIRVEGYKHVDRFTKKNEQGGKQPDQNYASTVIKAFTEEDSDIVLVEGSADAIAKRIIKEQPDVTGDLVIKQHREQVYMAWVALKTGKEVRSWDIPWIDQMKYSRKYNGADALVGWAAAAGAKHLHESSMPLSVDNLVEAMAGAANLTLTDEERVQGVTLRTKLSNVLAIDLTEGHVDTVIKRYTQEQLGVAKSYAELTAQDVEQLSSPTGSGETNKVSAGLNTLREGHAIDTIDEVKKTHNKIFVTCGGSHAVTWEPALDAMFQTSERQGLASVTAELKKLKAA